VFDHKLKDAGAYTHFRLHHEGFSHDAKLCMTVHESYNSSILLILTLYIN